MSIPTTATNGFDAFVTAYLACLLWTCTDNSNPERGGEPLDAKYSIIDIPADQIELASKECRDFYDAQQAVWAGVWMTDSDAGHNFALTRNGHGAGFWDRGLGDVGDELSDACKPYGEVYLYEGDNGQLYYGRG